jgi:hypothetical protein
VSRVDDDVIQIANEFTLVQVREVQTRNGERLEISSPRLGYKIHLDPLELESLTWQTTDTFSRLLDQPFGPGGDIRVDPLSKILEDRHG